MAPDRTNNIWVWYDKLYIKSTSIYVWSYLYENATNATKLSYAIISTARIHTYIYSYVYSTVPGIDEDEVYVYIRQIDGMVYDRGDWYQCERKYVFICGIDDMNLIIIIISFLHHWTSMMDSMCNYSFIPLITMPTIGSSSIDSHNVT